MQAITDMLSAFISEHLQPIAEAIELAQMKLAQQHVHVHRMSETDMACGMLPHMRQNPASFYVVIQ